MSEDHGAALLDELRRGSVHGESAIRNAEAFIARAEKAEAEASTFRGVAHDAMETIGFVVDERDAWRVRAEKAEDQRDRAREIARLLYAHLDYRTARAFDARYYAALADEPEVKP